jgi:hypothetical protein
MSRVADDVSVTAPWDRSAMRVPQSSVEKALECDERARVARLDKIKKIYEELARNWRSMAETWEGLIAMQSEHRGGATIH